MQRVESSIGVNVNVMMRQGTSGGRFTWPTKPSLWAVIPWQEAPFWSQAHASLTRPS